MKRLLIWMKKPDDGIVVDRRSTKPCTMWGVASLAIVCFWSAIAMTASGNTTGVESLNEHSGAVMEFQWWMIGGLFSFAAIALAFIYQGGRNSDRAKFAILFDKIEGIHTKMDGWKDTVLTKEMHNMIDHSPLCAVCRNEELKKKGKG